MKKPTFGRLLAGAFVGALILGMQDSLANQPTKDPPPRNDLSSAKEHLMAAERAVKKDELAEALRHVNLCLKDWPDKADVHLLAARINRLLADYAKVEKHLAECKRIQGATKRIQLEWLLLRSRCGELSEVEPGLLRLLEQKHPESLLIREALADAYMRELRLWAAHACLQQWLEQEPDSIRALSWRGWVRERFGDQEGAREDYHRVLKLTPGNSAIRLRLVQLLLGSKEVMEAQRHLRILLETCRKDVGVRLALAECRHLQGKGEEAEKLLDAILKEAPQNSGACYQRGRLAAEPAEREKWFHRAVKLDSNNVEARYALYLSLQQQGRKKEAATELQRFKKASGDDRKLKELLRKLERSPNDADQLTTVSEIFLRRHDEEMARPFLLRAVAADPRHRKAHDLLARYYESKRQPQEAAKHRNLAK